MVQPMEAGTWMRRMQDQLVVFMALGSGTSRVLCGAPTLHTRTAIAVAEQLSAARFTLSKLEGLGSTWLMECVGAGIIVGQ